MAIETRPTMDIWPAIGPSPRISTRKDVMMNVNVNIKCHKNVIVKMSQF